MIITLAGLKITDMLFHERMEVRHGGIERRLGQSGQALPESRAEAG
jgi:hypothetical protein